MATALGSGRGCINRMVATRNETSCRSLTGRCSHSRVSRLRAIHLSRGRTIETRTRRYRAQRLHRMSANRYDSVPFSCRMIHQSVFRTPIDRNDSISRKAAVSNPERMIVDSARTSRMRTHWRAIVAGMVADVKAPSTATAPPRLAAPWRPTPTKVVVEVPGPALEWHIAPALARNPNVAKAWRPHPVAVAVGIPPRIGGIVRRPD